MNTERSNTVLIEKFCYSIDDIMERYGLDQWTIRMWVDWFEIPGHISTADGGILFTPQAMEQIGVLCRLTKKRMTLADVRKHLESEFGCCYC